MLYIEAGQLFNYLKRHASLTGIQRLTLACAKHLHLALGPDQIRLLAYDGRSASFFSAPADIFNSSDALEHVRLNIGSKLWEKARISSADTVLLTETWWWPEGIGEATLKLKQESGARFIRFIHDVIPVVAPRYVSEKVSEKFRRGLIEAIKSANIVLTNSKASRHDLALILEKEGIKTPNIKVVPLAHEFEEQQPFRRPAAFWLPSYWKMRGRKPRLMRLLEQMRHHPHIVCVGTIEPRKNVLRLLKAFATLNARLGDRMPRLVLAGRWGWNFHEIRAFLKSTRNIDGKVELLLGFDDEALKAIYENCLFTVYLSHYEGWGLPVGESMWFGKPVIASNTSSIPEVGGKLVDYVDPDDQDDIVANIEKLILDKAHREKRIAALKAARLRTWDDFAEDLISAIDMKPKLLVDLTLPSSRKVPAPKRR